MIKLFLTILGLLVFLTSSLFSAEWQITNLDNGLKVMILEAHQVPQVNISTSVKVGAKNETDFYDGATHLLEHLILFRGTEKMTGEKVGEEMRKHGAYFNGFTSQDWTDFEISLPAEFQFRGEGRYRINVQGIIGLIENIEVIPFDRDLVGLLHIRQSDRRLRR